MKIGYSTFSEQGQRRDNQDYIQIVTDKEKQRAAFVLCDGMGGHAMGGMASKIVATSIARGFRLSTPKTTEDIHEIFMRAIWTLDTMSEIYGGVQMGTTMVMAFLDGDMLTVAHCGDSRCYVYSEDKELKYRTEDHVKNELIVKSFFAGYPEKAIPDVKTIKVSKGDRILLCSDGLYSNVYPDILRDRMFDDKPLDDIMDTYKFLCEKYSSDNYSGILVAIK